MRARDIDGDGDIDIFDIVLAAGNYGDSWSLQLSQPFLTWSYQVYPSMYSVNKHAQRKLRIRKWPSSKNEYKGKISSTIAVNYSPNSRTLC